jgi:ELWxxDGT repeat protein
MSHEVLFFSARDEEHGRELWRTDGTEGGTALVKDLWPGSRSGDPHGLAEHDSSLYFFADDGTGEHLWTSDGTAGGTVIIRRFHPRARFGVCGRDRTIADVAGTLYFAGADGRDGCQLWKSDGTQAGTELVAVIADPPLYGGSNPYGFTGLGGLVYFIADDQSLHGRALWRSDGTEVGTRMVSDPQRGRSPCCTAGNWIGPMVNFDRNLYFRSRGHRFGQELWRTDGTTAGTTPL